MTVYHQEIFVDSTLSESLVRPTLGVTVLNQEASEV